MWDYSEQYQYRQYCLLILADIIYVIGLYRFKYLKTNMILMINIGID